MTCCVRLHKLGWVILYSTELDWFRACCIELCCVELGCVVLGCVRCVLLGMLGFAVLDCVRLSVLACVMLVCIILYCMCHVGWVVSGKAWWEVLVYMDWS